LTEIEHHLELAIEEEEIHYHHPEEEDPLG